MNSLNNNFKQANFHQLYQQLLAIDWGFINNIDNVEGACSKFYDTLMYSLFDSTVPKYSPSNLHPSWFTSDIIHSIRLKNSAFKKYKKGGSLQSSDSFKRLRSKSKALINIAYTKYVPDLEQSISIDSKKFWSFIQSKKVRSRIPNLLLYKGNELSDPSEIVEAFADFFDSVFIGALSTHY